MGVCECVCVLDSQTLDGVSPQTTPPPQLFHWA